MGWLKGREPGGDQRKIYLREEATPSLDVGREIGLEREEGLGSCLREWPWNDECRQLWSGVAQGLATHNGERKTKNRHILVETAYSAKPGEAKWGVGKRIMCYNWKKVQYGVL